MQNVSFRGVSHRFRSLVRTAVFLCATLILSGATAIASQALPHVFADAQGFCSPSQMQQDINSTGTIFTFNKNIAGGSMSFTNHDNCTALLAIISYQSPDSTLAVQKAFSGNWATVAPGETKTIQTSVPSCGQVDLFALDPDMTGAAGVGTFGYFNNPAVNAYSLGAGWDSHVVTGQTITSGCAASGTQNTPPATPAAQGFCSPSQMQQDINSTGTIFTFNKNIAGGSMSFTNHDTCTALLAIVSYQSPNSTLKPQIAFNGNWATVAPGETKTIQAAVPSCGQVDLFALDPDMTGAAGVGTFGYFSRAGVDAYTLGAGWDSHVVTGQTLTAGCPAPTTQAAAATVDIVASKAVDKTTANVGDTLTYHIAWSNVGPGTADVVIVRDVVPTHLQWTDSLNAVNGVTVVPSQGNGGEPMLELHSPPMTAGTTNSVDLRFKVMPDACTTDPKGIVQNFAIASTNSQDSNPGNNTTPLVTTTINCNQTPPPGPQSACIQVLNETFDVNGSPLHPTVQFSFRLDNGQTIQNDASGNATFQNVTPGTHTVTESVPSGWRLFSIAPQNGVVNVIAGSQCVALDFKNQQLTPNPTGNACINVTKTALDSNGNAIFPVPAFSFTLDGNQTLQNDPNGQVVFQNVTSGNHTITESIPSGWRQTQVLPSGGTVNAIPASGCASVHFTDQQSAGVTPAAQANTNNNYNYNYNTNSNTNTSTTPSYTPTYYPQPYYPQPYYQQPYYQPPVYQPAVQHYYRPVVQQATYTPPPAPVPQPQPTRVYVNTPLPQTGEGGTQALQNTSEYLTPYQSTNSSWWSWFSW